MISADKTTWTNDCINGYYGGDAPRQVKAGSSSSWNGYDYCGGSDKCVSAWTNDYGGQIIGCNSQGSSSTSFCCVSGGGSASCGSGKQYSTWQKDCQSGCFGTKGTINSGTYGKTGYDVCGGSDKCLGGWTTSYGGGVSGCGSVSYSNPSTLTFCCKCVDSSWTPDPSTICSGESFTQTSNCENTRTATGTKDCSSCSDTDGGINYYEKGTATSSTASVTDFCLTNKTLQEVYCDSNNYVNSVQYTCPVNCSQGACINCTDTDGGVDIYTKGTVTTPKGSFTDYCQPDGSVFEYSCEPEGIGKRYECSSGCQDGACIPTTEDEIILKLNYSTDAKAELWNQTNYNILITYSSIFGETYSEGNPHECTGNNLVLKLSDKTNAFAQFPQKKTTCTGSLIDCESLTHQECLDESACYWNSGMLVPDECVSACEQYSESDCKIHNECEWESGWILGSCNAKHCSELANQDCESVKDCSLVEQEINNNYPEDVCYGDLRCEITQGNCSPARTCVVKLSGKTNAQLETCDNSNYAYSICCSKSKKVNCEQFTTKDSCWDASDDCTWTPNSDSNGNPITTREQGGGCCGLDKKGFPMVWKPGYGCFETGEMCTLPASLIINQGQKLTINSKGPIREYNGKYQYCEQVTKGMNLGVWKDIQIY
ncbi:hypothetical protein DRN73_07230 [Candidatus Pacearchaeota archaeon]|nr:MAG: hypothetical protein DRN73_07230 [Candidatus Pacearchaeota archaeon]